MPSKKTTVPSLQKLAGATNYNNSLVVKHYAGMTLQKALKSTSPSIGRMSKADEENTKKCICALLVGTSMYFDSELSERKGMVIAEEMLACFDYRQLKLEDVLAICIEIKESDIFKLTPARILKHISSYEKRRVQQSINNHLQLTQESNNIDSNIDERIKKSIRHIDRSNKEVVRRRMNVRKFYK